jgi:hypothetical protein
MQILDMPIDVLGSIRKLTKIICEDDVRASTDSILYPARSAAKLLLLVVGKADLPAGGRDSAIP